MLEWLLNKLLKRADELEIRRRRLEGEAKPLAVPQEDEWMRSGFTLQQAGQLEEAEAFYRKILFNQPAHADALFMLSEIKEQQGQYDQALDLCRKAVAANGEVAVFQASLAGLCNRVGALGEAEAAYREAVRLDPDNPEYMNNLGCAIRDQGRLSEALEWFERGLGIRADFPQALYNIGMVFRKQGEFGKAIEYIERALDAARKAQETFPGERGGESLTPQLAMLHLARGDELVEKNQVDEAITHFLRAVDIDRTLDAAWVNLGNAYGKAGRQEEALPCLIEAIKANPSCTRAFSNLAVALNDMGNCERAKEYLAEVEKLVPDFSWQVVEGDRFCYLDAAMGLLDYALSLDNMEADFLVNKAVMQETRGDRAAALSSYRAAIKLKPESVDAHLNMGMGLLLAGEMEEGWEEYDWRMRSPTWPSHQELMEAAPLWAGGDISGKSLLLHSEQGFGDTIQFIRYHRLAAERCGRLMVLCQPAVRRLLETMPGIGEIYSEGELIPEYDFQIPLMSLPRVFGTRVDTIPAEVPYFFPPSDAVEEWRRVIGGESTGRKVGLVWAGSKAHKGNRFRSLSLDALAPLADVPGVSFISLQKGEEAVDAKALPAGMKFIDYTARLSDFADTAALIANLDLVIAVDTSVAHVAGALGKPVWVLLPFGPDWRWLLEREDSPWYPSMRLFRQTHIGDWDGCIAKVRDELAKLAMAPGL